jgi:hypothetical protein
VSPFVPAEVAFDPPGPIKDSYEYMKTIFKEELMEQIERAFTNL